MLKEFVLVSAFLGAVSPAFAAATIDPKNAIALTPDQIQWTKGEASDQAWPIGVRMLRRPGLVMVKHTPGLPVALA